MSIVTEETVQQQNEQQAAADTNNRQQAESGALSLEEQASIDRGDVIPAAKEEQLSSDDLAVIAGVQEQPGGQTPEGIPRARFNEVNEENKALKERIAALLTQQQEADAASAQQQNLESADNGGNNVSLELKELRAQYREVWQQVMLDPDDTDNLARLDELEELIDKTVLEVASTTAEQRLLQKKTQEDVQTELQKVVVAAVEKYPFLDNQSEQADFDAINLINMRMNELVTTGISRDRALQIAVDEKAPRFAVLHGTAVPDRSKAEQARAEREAKARETAANTSIQQPAALPARTERDSFAVDVNNLSGAQIKSLSEEQKARMRGDIL